jgi:dissimilatory sulfite reductase (desulfoviridin) alpha/beta subunit
VKPKRVSSLIDKAGMPKYFELIKVKIGKRQH